jgi:hypothetical protein
MWVWTLAIASASEWAVLPHIGTDVPFHVGLGVDVEAPFRLRAGVSAGYMPGPYVDLTNAVATGLFPAYYTEEIASIVDSTLDQSFVLRSRLGWRPFEKHGWHFGAGFTVAALGGDATAPELIAAVLDMEPPGDREPNLVVDARATVGFIDVGTGWDIPIWRDLFIRPALGWSFAVTSNTVLEPSIQPQRPAARESLDALVEAGEIYLDDTFTGYVHPPWIALSIGWRFGGGS